MTILQSKSSWIRFFPKETHLIDVAFIQTPIWSDFSQKIFFNVRGHTKKRHTFGRHKKCSILSAFLILWRLRHQTVNIGYWVFIQLPTKSDLTGYHFKHIVWGETSWDKETSLTKATSGDPGEKTGVGEIFIRPPSFCQIWHIVIL